jgi:hypothetical protein
MDSIYHVETEKLLYSESLSDAYLAYRQFRKICPAQGCQSIKKKLKKKLECWSYGVLASDLTNTPSPQSSSHGDGLTAVDYQGMSGDKSRLIGNQEEHAVGDLFRAAHA